MKELVYKELEKLNEIHTFIYYNGKAQILNFHKNKDGTVTISFSNRRDFEAYYENKIFYFEGKRESLGKIWLRWTDRNTKHEIDFLPCRQVGADTVNLWQGFGVVAKEGSCRLYLNHIFEVIASGDNALYNYLLDFMADAVQNPDKKPGVALVLQSDQGAGKGVFVDNFMKLFGTHAATVTNSAQIFGRFNSILSTKLLIFLDEGLWSGDKQNEGNLKSLITSDRVTIERKGIDPIEERNFVRLIVASNNDWVFPIGRKERRGCIIGVSGHRIGDYSYFKAIQDEMDNGGREALMKFLLDRDLTGVDIRNYPRTEAYEEQLLHTLDGFDGWFHGCLDTGNMFQSNCDELSRDTEWTTPIDANDLFEEFVRCAKQRGIKHHLSSAQFGKKLKKFVPKLEVKRMGPSHNRRNRYLLPPLDECRKSFEDVQGTHINWSE